MGLRLSLALAGSILLAPWPAAFLLAAPITAAPLQGEDPEAAFAWFDTLGYPDVKRAPFVQVATGLTEVLDEAAFGTRNVHGFLLDDEVNSFRVFVVHTLETQTFEKTQLGGNGWSQISFDVRDLNSYLEARIQEGTAREGPPSDRPLSKRAELFALAWAAARRGLTEPAARLFTVVERMANETPRTHRRLSTRAAVAAEIAHAEMRRGIGHFGDPSVPRTKLLERFQWLAANFPESEHRARAVRTAELLARMTKEDAEHVVRPADVWSTERQIAERIFQLREQRGWQWWAGSECDIFWSPFDDDSPAHRLVAFGYDAVPQLIEALGDERFSRTVDRRPSERHALRILTVGHCAEQVLAGIAARRFDLPPSSGGRRSPAEELAARQALVRDWYEGLRRHGERKTLIAAVETGDSNAPLQAERLAARYPADVERPILVGAGRAANADIRNRLIERLADVPWDESLPFLLNELETENAGRSYLSAAQVLHRRGHPQGLASILRRWQAAAQLPDPSQAERDAALGEFLVQTNTDSAVSAVAELMNRFPVYVRMRVVEACNLSPLRVIRPGAAPGTDPGSSRTQVALLVAALEDDQERHPWT